jgi:hypothetical protein
MCLIRSGLLERIDRFSHKKVTPAEITFYHITMKASDFLLKVSCSPVLVVVFNFFFLFG